MRKFLLGVIVGILIFFCFIWFGDGKIVKKVGEDLTDTGKKMEVFQETIKKEKDEVWSRVKKIFKEEKETQKKSQ